MRAAGRGGTAVQVLLVCRSTERAQARPAGAWGTCIAHAPQYFFTEQPTPASTGDDVCGICRMPFDGCPPDGERARQPKHIHLICSCLQARELALQSLQVAPSAASTRAPTHFNFSFSHCTLTQPLQASSPETTPQWSGASAPTPSTCSASTGALSAPDAAGCYTGRCCCHSWCHSCHTWLYATRFKAPVASMSSLLRPACLFPDLPLCRRWLQSQAEQKCPFCRRQWEFKQAVVGGEDSDS